MAASSRASIKSLGDSALLIQLGDEIDLGVNRRVHALAAALQTAWIPGLLETVPAYATLVVHYDPLQLTYEQVAAWAGGQLGQADAQTPKPVRTIEVPVRYGGVSGPDLEEVAASKGLSVDEIIRLHSGREYVVYMMGFTPGFPYMGALDERLVVPRLETPRTLVRAGTVAIAGSQTGIYPLDSPGGWRLIGWTPVKLFDPAGEMPFLFAPGDMVRFVPVEGDDVV
jgi:inhibitor of KinA